MPILSLVTGAMDRPHGIKRLVESIQRETSVDWELVIADASKTPVQFDDARIRVIPEPERLGFTKAYNRAFRECLGKWVIWLNDDAEVCPKYDVNAIRFMESHPTIGLGCLHYAERRSHAFHVSTYLGMPYANFGIISRELGERLGWFNEELEMYGTDNDITFRVLKSGKGVAGIKDARVIHHSEDDAPRLSNQKYRMPAAQFLNERYGKQRYDLLKTYRKFMVRSA